MSISDQDMKPDKQAEIMREEAKKESISKNNDSEVMKQTPFEKW